MGCTAQTHVAFANLGDTPYQGSVSLQLFQLTHRGDASVIRSEHEELRQVFELSLAPGSVSQRRLVGSLGGDTLLRIEPAMPDCDPSNDEVSYNAMVVECLF